MVAPKCDGFSPAKSRTIFVCVTGLLSLLSGFRSFRAQTERALYQTCGVQEEKKNSFGIIDEAPYQCKPLTILALARDAADSNKLKHLVEGLGETASTDLQRVSGASPKPFSPFERVR
jgi:hypothetical protein